MKIVRIKAESLAEKIGLHPGDRLLKINGKRVLDEIDYKFRITEESLVLDLEINGKLDRVEVDKEYDVDLGVEFEEMKIRECANDCVFCFVDQNPPNMRKGLYLRDGDYRMSYLHGHYITMTNMAQNELNRIVKQRLSPLYISIHVTNPQLRQKLFLYKKDDRILDKIRFLTEHGIELHTQIVLMPTINDMEYLLETLKDIYQFYPVLKTCTIVPVGLTKHRRGLMDIPIVDEAYAKKMLDLLPDIRKKYSGNKSPFLLCSDEWYILANVPCPDIHEYGDVDLVENGVGQVRKFINGLYSESAHYPKYLDKPIHVNIVTGTLIKELFNHEVVPILLKIKNLTASITSVQNYFFGESVTVSGLLTGRDIIKNLKDQKLGDEVWLSHRVLNDEGNCTLDDMTLDDISLALNCPVKVGQESFLKLLTELKNV